MQNTQVENVAKMPLSIFKCFTDRQPATATLATVVSLIKSDPRLKALTEAYRSTGSKTVKQESMLFAVACRFCGGKSMRHVSVLTGLALVDIDHVDPQALPDMIRRVMADPHTLLCYVTISGRGLRIIFRYGGPGDADGVPVDNGPKNIGPDGAAISIYHKAFTAGNAHYAQLLGVQPDMQCKNLTRLSGLAHDPSVYLNTEAVPFTAAQLDEAAAQHARQSNTDRQMQRIESYFAAVIAPQLESDGIVYESGSHNNYVMRVGYKLAERRYAKEAVLQWAKKRFADYSDTAQVISSCFASKQQERQAQQSGTRDDTRYASVDSIKAFLDAHVLLRHNEVTARVEYADNIDKPQVWTPISDRIVNSLWSKMSQTAKVNIQDMYRVIDSDHIPLFNPFKSYLDSLPQVSPYPGTRLIDSKLRPTTDGTHHHGGTSAAPTSTSTPTSTGTDDGTDYIRQLAQTVTVKGGPSEQQRWYLYLRKWLVAMVAAWIDDDVVNNVILVLIGEQGAYKTTWFNYLLPPCLSHYFYTKTNANRMSKDDLITLTQYALVCCEELDTMRPSELNQLKAAVTMKSINERAAYAHFHEHRTHIASFCGTGNNAAFLSDPTGNRRWLPFEVEEIVSPREHPLCYDGIYAQALALYREGFVYWFTKDDIQQLNAHNRQFETPRLELELVNLYFRKPSVGHTGIFMSTARALQIISSGIIQKLSAVNVGRAFAELGFHRMRLHNDRGYLVEVRTSEEIRAFQLRQAIEAEDDEQ